MLNIPAEYDVSNLRPSFENYKNTDTILKQEKAQISL